MDAKDELKKAFKLKVRLFFSARFLLQHWRKRISLLILPRRMWSFRRNYNVKLCPW